MKVVLSVVLIGVVSGCCSSWLGDAQTSKNGGFISVDSGGVNVLPIVEAPAATTVKEIQFGIEFDLLRDLSGLEPGSCTCPPTVCAYCRYYINWAVVINVGQGVTLPSIGVTTTQITDLFPLSLPANDSNVLYAGVSSVQCFDDRISASYDSAVDPFFTLRYPDGITLNQGESIQLYWQSTPQSQSCVGLDGRIESEAVGWFNYVLNYAECLEFHPKYYDSCVGELEGK